MTISNVKKVVVFLFRLQKSFWLFLGGGDSRNGMVTAVKAIWIMSLTPGMKLVKCYQCLNFSNICISLRSLLLCIESTEIISSCHFARPRCLLHFDFIFILRTSRIGKKGGGNLAVNSETWFASPNPVNLSPTSFWFTQSYKFTY